MIYDFFKSLIGGRGSGGAAAEWPEALAVYMSKKCKPDKRKPLDQVRFVVFDSETSGLDLTTNRLLSIAGVAVTGLEVRLDDRFDIMVAQTDVGGADAAVIHGLVRSDLAEGLPEREAAARFLAFAEDAVLVAHHAAFDVRMLRKAIEPFQGAKVWNACVDTAKLAQRVEDGPMSSTRAHGAEERTAYQLDKLVERYGIDVPERHTAAGDALATALLLQRLLSKARRRGIGTLGDLLAR